MKGSWSYTDFPISANFNETSGYYLKNRNKDCNISARYIHKSIVISTFYCDILARPMFRGRTCDKHFNNVRMSTLVKSLKLVKENCFYSHMFPTRGLNTRILITFLLISRVLWVFLLIYFASANKEEVRKKFINECEYKCDTFA